MTDQMEGQVTFADLGIWCGRTLPEPSAAMMEKTFRQSSQKSSGSSSQMLPMFLYLTKASGQKPELSWEKEQTDARFPSVGEYMMHSFGVYPSEELDSRLSQILEVSADQRYSLSDKACAGILRRAEKRGKELPELLKKALEDQIQRGSCDS